MNVEETMLSHGFQLSASCSGKASYTKFIKHDGKRAYVSVSSIDGDGLPASLNDPVLVVVYDLKSGDELGPGEVFDSLAAYLESVRE